MDKKFFEKSEYQGLEKLYRYSPRSPRQLNFFNGSDTETVRLSKDYFLVSSTDSIAVEIHSQLYQDPETWGYLAIANSVSDLAASGAKPIGILLSAQWATDHKGKTKDRVYKSISQTLKKFEVPLLGGDSGSSQATVLTTTILGESKNKPLDRMGVKPGDVVILFGHDIGYGPALAFDYLQNKSKHKLEKYFRPSPNWQTIFRFRKYFKASIDTSDGIYNSLQTLATLNSVSFLLVKDVKLSKKIQIYKNKFNIPTEYFIESDLGDLQTCVVLDSTLYEKIKLQLPFHQVIGQAEKKSVTAIRYENDSRVNDYVALPTMLEQANFNYSIALNRWLKQFSRN